MKKIVLVFTLASFVISCKKIPAGGNKGVLKLKDGIERYSDDQMKAPVFTEASVEIPKDSLQVSEVRNTNMKKDSAKTETPVQSNH
jgi:hypothetical protein